MSCSSREKLKNEDIIMVAKIDFHTAENGPSKMSMINVLRKFLEFKDIDESDTDTITQFQKIISEHSDFLHYISNKFPENPCENRPIQMSGRWKQRDR